MHPANLEILKYFKLKLAEARSAHNYQKAKSLSKVVDSISRYPLPIKSREEAMSLLGVGPTIVSQMDVTLLDIPVTAEDADYFKSVALKKAEKFAASDPTLQAVVADEQPEVSKPSLSMKAPQTGSAGWTILLVFLLFSHEFEKQKMTSDEVKSGIELLKSHYLKASVFSLKSMQLLVSRNWLQDEEQSNPSKSKSRKIYKYFLTPSGLEKAQECAQTLTVPLTKFMPLKNFIANSEASSKGISEQSSKAQIQTKVTDFVEFGNSQNLKLEPEIPKVVIPVSSACDLKARLKNRGREDFQTPVVGPTESPEVLVTCNLRSQIDKKLRIVLVVDNREHSSGSDAKKQNISLYESLKSTAICVDCKMLPLCDIVWTLEMCHEEFPIKKESRYLLPWVIERKTLADLAASILDGRYEEQRGRLLKLPELETVIYLLEGFQNIFLEDFNSNLPVTKSALVAAVSNIQFVSGCQILATKDYNHSVKLLGKLHKYIEEYFRRTFSPVLKFEAEGWMHVDPETFSVSNFIEYGLWEQHAKKNQDNGDIFAKQLRCVGF
eukprot:GHVP01013564.1.p1 GENE.GHVP01013564.1~~GHVP01013564.1.p1  ORF type:complete len:559 (+),score=106.95 GHVP01013564.1:26-1678(+)